MEEGVDLGCKEELALEGMIALPFNKRKVWMRKDIVRPGDLIMAGNSAFLC